jgi:acyl-homoserine lactone acylase PvdQ
VRGDPWQDTTVACPKVVVHGRRAVGVSNPQFESVKEDAAAAVTQSDLRSVYAGVVHEDGRHQYYFGNDTTDAEELRETAAIQLGMLVRVLAEQSDSSVEEIADLGVERARAMELR